MPSTDVDKWAQWLDAIDHSGVNLTSWETEFIASLRDKFERYGDRTKLSDRQVEQLERIYSERVP